MDSLNPKQIEMIEDIIINFDLPDFNYITALENIENTFDEPMKEKFKNILEPRYIKTLEDKNVGIQGYSEVVIKRVLTVEGKIYRQEISEKRKKHDLS